MDLRREFMHRLQAGERITDLCREYGISRKTGDKFKRRFEALGDAGLVDRSRAPKHIPHKTPPEVEKLVLDERRLHPTWGPRKLKAILERRLGRRFPSASAIGAVLSRHGVAPARKRRIRHEPKRTGLRSALAPNDVWCIDYKGHFRLGDRTYCYPLTITDQFSRFILGCVGMPAISDEEAREVCREIFGTYGMPTAIRSDNGVPFASTGLAGLTKLSAFWLQLGIELERIEPGSPQENGAHERMHRTLKAETARPARTNLLQQQERFDDFVAEFNDQRPHEALEMKFPTDVYQPSERRFPRTVADLDYPTHDDTIRVTRSGQIYVAGVGKVNLSVALAHQHVGLREEADGRWLVTFATIDLGHVGPGRSNRTLSPLQVAT